MPEGSQELPMLEGVDISYAQANYTPGGEDFIIINASRANNGGLNVGSYYRTQVNTARAHGKEVGHYFFNGNIDVTACANFFVNNLYDFRAGDVLVLDVEAEAGTGTAAWNPAQALLFAQIVKERTSQTIGIYLNKSLMNASNWSACVQFGCWLWIAYYQDTPPAISWWPGWTMWQYTSAGGLDRNQSQHPLAVIAGGAPAPEIKEDTMAKLIRNKTTGEVWAVNIDTGFSWYVPTPDYLTLVQGWKFFDDAPVQDMDDNVFTLYRQLADTNRVSGTADPAAIAKATAALIPAPAPVDYAALAAAIIAGGGTAPTAEQIAKAVNDDAAARLKS